MLILKSKGGIVLLKVVLCGHCLSCIRTWNALCSAMWGELRNGFDSGSLEATHQQGKEARFP